MKITAKGIQLLKKTRSSCYDKIKIEFLYNSNKLDGSNFSKEQFTMLLKERKIRGKHGIDDALETIHSLNLFDKIIDTAYEPLTVMMLVSWFNDLKQGTQDEREHDSCFKDPAAADELDAMLSEWNKRYARKTVSQEDIIYFHAIFNKISPFSCANGRISRYITLKQCLQNGTNLLLIDESYAASYEQALGYEGESAQYYLTNIFRANSLLLDKRLQPYKEALEYAEEMNN